MAGSNGSRSRFVALATVIGLVCGTGAANADFTFGEPTNMGAAVNSTYNDHGACLSRDGLSIYLVSDRPGGFGGNDLYVATRETTDDAWSEPVNLGSPANSQYTCWRPSLSSDSLSLYFSDGHAGLVGTPLPGGLGGAGDIWVLTRETVGDLWGRPVNLGPGVNSQHAIFPSISADGLSLYFTSHRPGAAGHCDLMLATRQTTSEPFGDPAFLQGAINTSSNGEWGPYISVDGRTLLFFRSLTTDIFMARRATTEEMFGPPTALPQPINTSHSEAWPSLSPDGTMLYFASDRPGGYGGADLWQVRILPTVDFDGNGQVDCQDICIVIESWGMNNPLCDIGPTPFGDGRIDSNDLEILMSYWGQEIPDPTLVAHWELDEADESVASDSAGDNDGTLYGEPIWQPAGGKLGGALELDGVFDHVETGFAINPAAGPFSVFAWVKGGAAGQAILSQAGGANWLMAAPDGALMTELKGTGRVAKPLVSAADITDGAWHRVGLTRDGTNRILYVDDVEVARDTQTSLPGSTGGLHIGAGSALTAGTFWSGLIDDIRIYSRAIEP